MAETLGCLMDRFMFTATLSSLLAGALNLVGVGGLLGLKSAGSTARTEATAKLVSLSDVSFPCLVRTPAHACTCAAGCGS